MPIEQLQQAIGAALRVAQACWALEIAKYRHGKAVEVADKPETVRQLQAVVEYCEREYRRRMADYMMVAVIRVKPQGT